VPPNADRSLETMVRVLVYVGDAANVTAEIASGIYLTAEDMDEHNADPDAHANLHIRAGQLSDTTLGRCATAEGEYNTASGHRSHAEGWWNQAVGHASHAEGEATQAKGGSSHAEGDRTVANGHASHAEGQNTRATHHAQHVFGEFNIRDTSTAAADQRGTYVEIVGNGTINADSNARTLDWDGNEALAGGLTLGKGTADECTITAAQLAALLALLTE